MAAVVAARDAYLEARKLVTQRRLELGHAIVEARRQEIEQGAIAKTLSLTREQVRRYQAEYELFRRIQVGAQIAEARERGELMADIAGRLGLTRDRARLCQDEYEKAIRLDSPLLTAMA